MPEEIEDLRADLASNKFDEFMFFREGNKKVNILIEALSEKNKVWR